MSMYLFLSVSLEVIKLLDLLHDESQIAQCQRFLSVRACRMMAKGERGRRLGFGWQWATERIKAWNSSNSLPLFGNVTSRGGPPEQERLILEQQIREPQQFLSVIKPLFIYRRPCLSLIIQLLLFFFPSSGYEAAASWISKQKSGPQK